MALRHRVELYAALLCPWHLQQRYRTLVEYERVRVVVDHHYVVATREIDQSLVGLHACIASCGHVWIVGPHQLDVREVHLLQLLKVGLPTVVFLQVVVDHLCTKNLAQRRVGGIARIWHEHFLAWIDEGEGDVQNAFL